MVFGIIYDVYRKLRRDIYDMTLHHLDLKWHKQSILALMITIKYIFVCIVKDGSLYQMVSYFGNRVYTNMDV